TAPAKAAKPAAGRYAGGGAGGAKTATASLTASATAATLRRRTFSLNGRLVVRRALEVLHHLLQFFTALPYLLGAKVQLRASTIQIGLQALNVTHGPV